MLTTIADIAWYNWLPEKASTFAKDIDLLFYFEVWLSVICFLGIGGVMIYFAIKYRHRSHEDHPHGSHHNNTLEITWSIIPLIIVMVIFVWGFKGMINMTQAPAYSTEIVVTASRWNWTYTYPNGGQSSMEEGLTVPVGQPIRIVLKAPLTDVLHSFYVPAFRIKKDVVPGRYNETWFEATEMGVYELYCAEYCGQQHSQMLSKVNVVSEDDYYAFLEKAANWRDNPPAVAGEIAFDLKGCTSCHSVEPNKVITGPSLANLFGRQEQLADGSSVMADENYIKESILNPSAKIVKGYKDQMNLIDMQEDEIDFVIAYLKSISEHYAGNRDALFEAPVKDEAAQ